MSFGEAATVAALVINVIIFMWILLKLAVYWEHYTSEVRDYKIVIAVYSLFVAAGTAQAISEYSHISSFVFVGIDVAGLFCLWELFRNRGRPAGAPRSEKSGLRWP